MLSDFLDKLFKPVSPASGAQQIEQVHTAATALLIETARADFQQDEVEEKTLRNRIANSLQLDEAAVDTLFRAASDAANESTSLYEFTRPINDHYTAEQKQDLIEAMWQVAWADGSISKYEEHLIRQVAELIYVPHKDFLLSKQAAKIRVD